MRPTTVIFEPVARSILLMLTALASGGCRETSNNSQEEETIASAKASTQARLQTTDPDCDPAREGRYRTFGNSSVRYAHICSQAISLSFQADPPGPDDGNAGWSITYFLQSSLCDRAFSKSGSGEQSSLFAGKPLPDDFFTRNFDEQVTLLRTTLDADLVTFGETCDIQFDNTPFTGANFQKFYADYGDGWWLTRNGDVVTANR